MSSVLELKIKNLVEGLDKVTDLAKELHQLGTEAKSSGSNAAEGKKGFTELSDGAQAYKTVGTHAFEEIRAEIDKVTTAHEQLTSTGTLSGRELQAVTDTTRSKLSGLNAELKGVTDKNKDAAGSGSALNDALGIMAPEAAAVSTGMSFLKDNVGKLISAFTALAVAYGLKESAEYAARTETLGITMNVVARNAGYGAEEIAKYEKEVKGLGITTQGTRESITQMIQAGLEIGPTAEGEVSQVAKLARAAQDLAVVTGENSSATLTKLITNIAQLDTVGLRYMGLTVNVEAAEQQFAISIGKSADQLTQKQKTQAVMNEALKQADKLNGAYEASMESVGKKVQSLKRYQEELANDIGNKLLPAYAALVDAATHFLKDADKTAQGIDRSGAASRLFAEGVKTFGDAIGYAMNTVLDLVREIYPTVAALGKAFLDLTADVFNAIAGLNNLFSITNSAGEKVSLLGQTIKYMIGTIALLLASLKDGIDIAAAAVYGLGGAALDIIGKIISGFGKLVSYFNKDFGKSIQDVGDSLQETGKGLIGFANETVDKFGRGESAVGKYQQSLRDAALYTEKLKEVTDFSKAEAEVQRLAAAVRQNGTYTKEFATQADVLNGKLKDMQATGQLTTAQLGELQKKLQRLAADDVAAFSKAVSDAGLKVVELGGQDHLAPLNKDFETVKAAVDTLGSSTKTTASVMQDAFAKGVDSAKTLAELNQIGASLGDVKKVAGDVQPALAEVGIKFDELFDKALKAAKTDRDFANLTAEVERLGREGTISGAAVARALDEIKEKSTGAAEALSRAAKQAADLAQSAYDVSRAHLDMIKAGADLGRASLDVLLKQNEYSRSGTELAKEELNLAKLNKQIAYEKSTEAKIAFDVAVSMNKLLIAQQQKINADKEVELHLDKDDVEEYRNRAKAAADVARATEDHVNVVRKSLADQQSIITTLEEQKVQQELVRDTVKATGVGYGLNKKAIEANTDAVGAMTKSQEGVTGRVADTRTALQNLKSDIDNAKSATANLAGEFTKAAAEAKKVSVPSPNPGGNNSYGTGGVWSGTGGSSDSGNFTQDNANKKAEKTGATNSGNSYRGTENTHGANSDGTIQYGPGITNINGKPDPDGNVITKDGEFLRNVSKDHYVNQKGIIVDENGKPSSTASDGHGGGVTDAGIADMLWDFEHGKRIEPTAENKQRAQTAFDAANANLEMYQSHTSAFSASGADSVMRMYNRARGLMAALGLNTGAGGSAGLNDGSGDMGGFGSGRAPGNGFYPRLDGSHRTGLDRVPKDGYIAELHQDEKVLTKEQARQYDTAPTVADLSRHLLEQLNFSSSSLPASYADQAVKAASQKPTETIQVNFSDSQGKTVPMTTDAAHKQSLLELLKRAKGVSA